MKSRALSRHTFKIRFSSTSFLLGITNSTKNWCENLKENFFNLTFLYQQLKTVNWKSTINVEQPSSTNVVLVSFVIVTYDCIIAKWLALMVDHVNKDQTDTVSITYCKSMSKGRF